ncbi:MAG: UDP-N-acetylmuramyl-tripeptide synthetase [bacterium]|nr:UDP-N-acetylmuramyl-tripeptide synthetase [bacterium]
MKYNIKELLNIMIDKILRHIEKLIPIVVYNFLRPYYHFCLSFAGALIYRFPSRNIKIVAVTGTKGKSSTTEIVNAFLTEAGYKTALSNTIRFKIGDESIDNKYKMSMPGRFYMQRFLRRAVDAKCDYAVVEITSQGAITYRHLFIDMNALIFTNISPEHIEAHGSYENYLNAKLSIGDALAKSKKRPRVLVVNKNDKEAMKFLEKSADIKETYSVRDAEPYEIKKEGIDFTLNSEKISSHLSGLFNLYNILGAISYVKTEGVSNGIIKVALDKLGGIPGRVQNIEAGQDFKVIVDYAHTPDSLEKVYQVFEHTRMICVLGNTGGGRDTWKRKDMALIADKYCDEIILANEDPYDEDPMKIVSKMKSFLPENRGQIIIDRREAINKAISLARAGDTVIITGKGTDPYIMTANNTKIEWSDAKVAYEEIKNIHNKK